jgi:3-deoxy-manno-octulosonate cytidylyltransferase (CMP-KDO synthetase)
LAAATVVIPARYASTRFPGKILASATGRPLVQHVVDQVRRCSQVREVIVAVDDPRITEALRRYDTRCAMTDPKHPSGTDRIAEVAAGLDDGLIVNVQGDEPEIDPEVIDQLISDALSSDARMATVATPFLATMDPADPNLVKLVINQRNCAMYFSRAPIPFRRDALSPAPTYYLHVGIYAYQRRFLTEIASWKPTPAELSERLEQLRVLEHGDEILVTIVQHSSGGIDTPEQYAAFVERFFQTVKKDSHEH